MNFIYFCIYQLNCIEKHLRGKKSYRKVQAPNVAISNPRTESFSGGRAIHSPQGRMSRHLLSCDILKVENAKKNNILRNK